MSEKRTWIVALVALGLLVLRMPGQFLEPQLWAEDGKVFLAEQHNEGAAALVSPYAGYYHFVPRATALLSAPFGLKAAPLFYLLAALAVQIGTVLLIYQSRLRMPLRHILCFTPLLVPIDGEVYANLTNTIWFTGLCLLVILAQPPPENESRRLSWGEAGLVLICGLNGPFVLLFAPVLLLRLANWRKHRERWPVIGAFVLSATVQLLMLETGRATESISSHGFGEWLVAGGAIFTGSLFTGEELMHLLPPLVWLPLNLGLLVLIGFGLKRAESAERLQMICLLLGAGAVMAAGYARVGWHPHNLHPFVGGRYFFIPYTCLLLLLSLCPRPARFLLVLAGLSALASFTTAPRPSKNWTAQVDQYQAGDFDGESLKLLVQPEGWGATLKRR